MPKTSIEQASSLSVLKLKVSNTSYVNLQLASQSSSKISTGPKVKPSILTIKKSSQFTDKQTAIKYQTIPVTLMSIILYQFSMKMMNAMLKST